MLIFRNKFIYCAERAFTRDKLKLDLVLYWVIYFLYIYLKHVRGLIKMFVDWHNKIDITFKFCTFSYKTISQIGANYQLSCVNGIKDTGYYIVHVLWTQRNVKLLSRTKSKSYFKSYFKNRTIISPFVEIKRNFILIMSQKSLIW